MTTRFWRAQLCRVVLALACFQTLAITAPSHARARVSVWYWLNSAPKTEWQQDFQDIRKLGFTDVLLVWGLDASAFALRTADSHEAILAAHRAGLGSYLFIWHARHVSLEHQPQFEQVDAAGHHLFAFDAFNQQWRHTQWKTYLQTLAHEYAHDPGFAGYVFDNSFAIGRIGSIDGPPPSASENYISYGAAEEAMFGKHPPASADDPAWNEWTSARQQWWADWASDTKAAIRAVDADPHHELVLEDGENTITPDDMNRSGLALGKVMPSFDVMNAYWAPAYSGPSSSAEQLQQGLTHYLQHLRKTIGDDSKLALSLRISEGDKEDLPGHANSPTLAQIKTLVDVALASGIRHLDLYGYRMGVYHLDAAGWHRYRPGTGATYPLTGQVEGKFICDRPEIWSGLRTYLHQIER